MKFLAFEYYSEQEIDEACKGKISEVVEGGIMVFETQDEYVTWCNQQ